jgi:hypothetical protein
MYLIFLNSLVFSTCSENFEDLSLSHAIVRCHSVTSAECVCSEQTWCYRQMFLERGVNVDDSTLTQWRLHEDWPIPEGTKILEMEQQDKYVGVVSDDDTRSIVVHLTTCNLKMLDIMIIIEV